MEWSHVLVTSGIFAPLEVTLNRLVYSKACSSVFRYSDVTVYVHCLFCLMTSFYKTTV